MCHNVHEFQVSLFVSCGDDSDAAKIRIASDEQLQEDETEFEISPGTERTATIEEQCKAIASHLRRIDIGKPIMPGSKAPKLCLAVFADTLTVTFEFDVLAVTELLEYCPGLLMEVSAYPKMIDG